MQAQRPFPQCTLTIAAATAIVSVLCVVCQSWRPRSVSLRHVRNAAGEVGDERKEKDRNGLCVCVIPHYLPSFLNE